MVVQLSCMPQCLNDKRTPRGMAVSIEAGITGSLFGLLRRQTASSASLLGIACMMFWQWEESTWKRLLK